MFIKSELTKDQRLKRKEKTLVGKSTKDKFRHLLKDCNETLKTIKALKPDISAKDFAALTSAIQHIADTNLTTSDRQKLFELMVCQEDLLVLFEDMKHRREVAAYSRRLNNILNFIHNFSHESYEFEMKFYQDKTSTLQDQLQVIVKAMQYKSSKMNYQITQVSDEIKHFEKDAIEKAKKMREINKSSFEYKELSHQIMDIDQHIELSKGNLSLTRKAKKSIDFLLKVFEQLTVLEEYTASLKKSGPTLQLIRRLYRNPNDIEVMETTLDLTEQMELIKNEINEVESLIKPAQRMITKDTEELVDDDLISKYQSMSDSEGS